MGGDVTGVAPASSRVAASTRADTTITAEEKQLMKACQEFESVFTHMLLRSMRKSVPKTEFLHGGAGEDIFQDMLDEQIATEASRTGQFGLAKIMFQQLSRSRLR